MIKLLLSIVFLTSTVFGYFVQDAFDPSELPQGESLDGGEYKSSFNFTCDPWKNYTIINDAYYDTYPDFNGEYCPEELRSPSGCGDFVGNTLETNCSTTWNIKYCSMKLILQAPQPVWKQIHLCAQDQMPEYQSLRPTLAPFGDLTFPPFGINRHRNYWAKSGEYDWCPPTRWLHNTEHGAIVFLYRPCIDPEDLCRIKQFIMSRPYDNTGSTKDPSNTGPFRWLLTPYANLVTKFALVSFPETLLTDCFDWNDWNAFIDKNYREGFEDLSLPGRYEYGWIGNSTCPGFDPIFRETEEEIEEEERAHKAMTTGEVAGIIIGSIIIILLIVIIVLLVRPKSGSDDHQYNSM